MKEINFYCPGKCHAHHFISNNTITVPIPSVPFNQCMIVCIPRFVSWNLSMFQEMVLYWDRKYASILRRFAELHNLASQCSMGFFPLKEFFSYDNMVNVETNFQISFDKNALIAEQGLSASRILSRPKMASVFEEILKEIPDCIAPMAIWDSFPITGINHNKLVLETDFPW